MFDRNMWVLVVFLLVGARASGVVRVSPTDPNIRYTGRWNFDNPSVPWIYKSGISSMNSDMEMP
ncbi:MAG: hypothetical protein KAT15_31865, partial [Bacteroidales bacterium]|nr:hypothetical protein [Bacteroidales bacterium]